MRNLPNWIKTKMQPDKAYRINSRKMQEAIKQLIGDNFGYPDFFLQFSKDMLTVTKFEIITKNKTNDKIERKLRKKL